MKGTKKLELAGALALSLGLVLGWSVRRVLSSTLPAMPDLTFERGTYDPKSLRVRLYLINNGEIASSNCTVTLKATKTRKGAQDQETAKFDQTLSGLQPGARLTMVFDLPSSNEFSFNPLAANVDSANVVRESNEKNNEWPFWKFGGSVLAPTPTP